MAEASDTVLSVQNLEVVYSDVIVALRGVSLDVPAGSIVTLLGANGAGKTSVLRAISGLLGAHHGKITKGSVSLDGVEINERSAAHIVGHGVAQVMEGRRLFADLTVQENLRAGALVHRPGRADLQEGYDRVTEVFPVLRDRWDSPAGYLSGGEQQMVAIGQALMARPRLLLLDEPVAGMNQEETEDTAYQILQIRRELGIATILVEHQMDLVMDLADRVMVLDFGRVVAIGTPSEIQGDHRVQEAYLGRASAS
jgi:branched-chain amino acid transport system ATP-binding protein